MEHRFGQTPGLRHEAERGAKPRGIPPLAAFALAVLTALVGCQGRELPPEISAVSMREPLVPSEGLFLDLMAAYPVSELPAGSDYHSVQVRKFVEVEVLDRFQILASVLDAIRQTHYSERVGIGWYKCMVAFQEPGEEGNRTMLQEWYVRSDFVWIGMQRVSRLQAKILEIDPETGLPELIRAQVDIYQAPSLNSDGSLADLGVWELRAFFGDVAPSEAEDFFYATAGVLGAGTSRITIQDRFTEDDGQGGEFQFQTRAILVRSAEEGYGVAEFPDFDACFGPEGQWQCEGGPPFAEVRFAYNDHYLTAAVDGQGAVSFDRTDAHELVHQYKIFRSDDGSDVERSLNFGFPVRVGLFDFGWYGAWHDRHELWVRGEQIADGVTVIRDGVPEGEATPTYTTASFPGALTRVDLVEGDLSQVANVPTEVGLHSNVRLLWNQGLSRWDQCLGEDEMGGCTSVQDFTSSLSTLEQDESNPWSHVWINGCLEESPGNWVCPDYVYLSESPGPGFFEAAFDEATGRLQSTGVPLDTASLPDGFELWAGTDSQAFVEYTGEFSGPTTTTGWVKKELVEFDFDTWAPEFNDAADSEFALELGREYFIHKPGTDLRVTRVAENGNADDYVVYMEVAHVAKPVEDLSSVYAPGTLLEIPWEGEEGSKFVLNTDSGSENYLLLEYAQVSEGDEANGHSVGDVVTEDWWGLRVVGDTTPLPDAVIYNWEYQGEFEQWGGVTYLVDESGEYVLLDEPLRFAPIALPSTDDLVHERPEAEWLTYALGYDGWLQGLPDIWHDLGKVEFTDGGVGMVLANNVRVPDGLPLTNQADGEIYFVKAVDIGIFLGVVNDFPQGSPPDLALADALDLDADLPTFVAPDMDTEIPEDVPLLFVRGVAVE